ncbi:hypothetical protein WJX74_009386 [Apatococcus lobatus]|uniref:Mediator complex subunit Med12 domain-containing protein n=1 Tax=Apatococcus lobatus TaxID=904363 RepID=A0AAW1RHT1_9CHLO
MVETSLSPRALQQGYRWNAELVGVDEQQELNLSLQSHFSSNAHTFQSLAEGLYQQLQAAKADNDTRKDLQLNQLSASPLPRTAALCDAEATVWFQELAGGLALIELSQRIPVSIVEHPKQLLEALIKHRVPGHRTIWLIRMAFSLHQGNGKPKSQWTEQLLDCMTRTLAEPLGKTRKHPPSPQVAPSGQQASWSLSWHQQMRKMLSPTDAMRWQSLTRIAAASFTRGLLEQPLVVAWVIKVLSQKAPPALLQMALLPLLHVCLPAAGYDRPSRQALWNICQQRLHSLPAASGSSHLQVLLADGFSTALAALLQANPMILLEHAARLSQGPTDALERSWKHLPGKEAAQKQTASLSASMRMLVKGSSPAAVAAKAFKALNSCQGTTERLQALEDALASSSVPAAQLQTNVVSAICCYACDEGDRQAMDINISLLQAFQQRHEGSACQTQPSILQRCIHAWLCKHHPLVPSLQSSSVPLPHMVQLLVLLTSEGLFSPLHYARMLLATENLAHNKRSGSAQSHHRVLLQALHPKHVRAASRRKQLFNRTAAEAAPDDAQTYSSLRQILLKSLQPDCQHQAGNDGRQASNIKTTAKLSVHAVALTIASKAEAFTGHQQAQLHASSSVLRVGLRPVSNSADLVKPIHHLAEAEISNQVQALRPWQKQALAIMIASSTVASVQHLLNDSTGNDPDCDIKSIPAVILFTSACLSTLCAARMSLRMLLHFYHLTLQRTLTHLQNTQSEPAGGQGQAALPALKGLQHCLTKLLCSNLDLLCQDEYLHEALATIAQPIGAATADVHKSYFQDAETLVRDLVRHARHSDLVAKFLADRPENWLKQAAVTAAQSTPPQSRGGLHSQHAASTEQAKASQLLQAWTGDMLSNTSAPDSDIKEELSCILRSQLSSAALAREVCKALQAVLRDPSLGSQSAAMASLLQRPGVVKAVFQNAQSIEMLRFSAYTQPGEKGGCDYNLQRDIWDMLLTRHLPKAAQDSEAWHHNEQLLSAAMDQMLPCFPAACTASLRCLLDHQVVLAGVKRGLSMEEAEKLMRKAASDSADGHGHISEVEKDLTSQVIVRLLHGWGGREAVLVAEVLGSLKRGILDYLLQQIGWILQDGSTLWGHHDLAQVLHRRCSKPAAPQSAPAAQAGSNDSHTGRPFGVEQNVAELASAGLQQLPLLQRAFAEQMVAQLATLAERLKAGPQPSQPPSSGHAMGPASLQSTPRTPPADPAPNTLPSRQGSIAEPAASMVIDPSEPASPSAPHGLSTRASGSAGTSSFGAGRLRRMNLGNAVTVPVGAAAGVQVAVWLRLAILQPLLPVVHADSASKGLRHVLALALLRLLSSPLIRSQPSLPLQLPGQMSDQEASARAAEDLAQHSLFTRILLILQALATDTGTIWMHAEQVKGPQASRFMSEVLQNELDKLRMPLHVRHSLQLVLGTDATMTRYGKVVDLPRPWNALPSVPPGNEEQPGTEEEHTAKRQCLQEQDGKVVSTTGSHTTNLKSSMASSRQLKEAIADQTATGQPEAAQPMAASPESSLEGVQSDSDYSLLLSETEAIEGIDSDTVMAAVLQSQSDGKPAASISQDPEVTRSGEVHTAEGGSGSGLLDNSCLSGGTGNDTGDLRRPSQRTALGSLGLGRGRKTASPGDLSTDPSGGSGRSVPQGTPSRGLSGGSGEPGSQGSPSKGPSGGSSGGWGGSGPFDTQPGGMHMYSDLLGGSGPHESPSGSPSGGSGGFGPSGTSGGSGGSFWPGRLPDGPPGGPPDDPLGGSGPHGGPRRASSGGSGGSGRSWWRQLYAAYRGVLFAMGLTDMADECMWLSRYMLHGLGMATSCPGLPMPSASDLRTRTFVWTGLAALIAVNSGLASGMGLLPAIPAGMIGVTGALTVVYQGGSLWWIERQHSRETQMQQAPSHSIGRHLQLVAPDINVWRRTDASANGYNIWKHLMPPRQDIWRQWGAPHHNICKCADCEQLRK